MKIALTSDIHVDTSSANDHIVDVMIARLRDERPDVLVIGGDISPSLEQLAATLKRFSALDCCRLFVCGNHDIWIDSKRRLKSGIDSTVKYTELIPQICRDNGFELLHDRPVVQGGVGFVGCMGWYDYSFGAEDLDISRAEYVSGLYKNYFWNDKRYAWWLQHPGRKLYDLKNNIMRRGDEDVCRDMAAALAGQLASADLSGVTQVIVITHFVPFRSLVAYTGKPSHDFFMAFAGSSEFEKIIRADARVTHVLYGHSHLPNDSVVDGIRAISSPVGYLGEVPVSDDDRQLEDALAVFEL